MQITRITEDYSVSPQIGAADVADIAAGGFRAIMCNRPDGESPDQTDVAVIRSEAEARGLAFSFVPVVSGAMTGFAHANDISKAGIRRAAQRLTLLDPAKGTAAPAPRQNNRHLYTDGNALETIPFASKIALLEKMDGAARARDQSGGSECVSVMCWLMVCVGGAR